ncbi:hypothetical protein DVH24_042430 [Malus domestica]|uniref:Uncharacterized protein n=1 Tax=Malus domestica TaxID=3750 RepID=A0A498IY39_MALDO|nr:hypothetical protein DVH24_042430 [Malus domestica]
MYRFTLFRFHPACIDMNIQEAKRLDHFFCEGCSSEGQKKLQNSHTASRHPDTKAGTRDRALEFSNPSSH